MVFPQNHHNFEYYLGQLDKYKLVSCFKNSLIFSEGDYFFKYFLIVCIISLFSDLSVYIYYLMVYSNFVSCLKIYLKFCRLINFLVRNNDIPTLCTEILLDGSLLVWCAC